MRNKIIKVLEKYHYKIEYRIRLIGLNTYKITFVKGIYMSAECEKELTKFSCIEEVGGSNDKGQYFKIKTIKP